jgi:hypothetical protein
MLDRVSLKLRFAILGTVLFLIGIWIPLQHAISVLQNTTEGLLVVEHNDDTLQMGFAITSALRLRTAVIQSVATTLQPNLLSHPEALRAYLGAHKDLTAMFRIGLVVISPKGIVLADYPAIPGRLGADFSGHASYRKVIATDKPAMGNPILSKYAGVSILPIAVPIHDSAGKVIGVLSSATDLLIRPDEV